MWSMIFFMIDQFSDQGAPDTVSQLFGGSHQWAAGPEHHARVFGVGHQQVRLKRFRKLDWFSEKTKISFHWRFSDQVEDWTRSINDTVDWKDPLSVRALNDQVKCILLELYYSVNIYQLLYEIPQSLEDVYGILFLVTWKLLFVMCSCLYLLLLWFKC